MARRWLTRRYSLARLLVAPFVLGLLYTTFDRIYFSEQLIKQLRSPNGAFTSEMWVRRNRITDRSPRAKLVVRKNSREGQAETINTWDSVQLISPKLDWTTDSRYLLLTATDVVTPEGSTIGRSSESPKTRLFDGSHMLVLFDSSTGSTKINDPVRQACRFTKDDMAKLRFFDPEEAPKPQRTDVYRGYSW